MVDARRLPDCQRPGVAASVSNDLLGGGLPEVRSFFETLNDYVIEKLNAEVDRANAAEDSDDLWTAYKTLSTVTVQFKGYEISPDVKSKIAELERDESIKAELAAQKQMTLVRRVLNSTSAAARKRAELMLEKITNDFPGTEAATEAETLLTPM